MWQYNYGPDLYHHGIKGMKWGVRRFQRSDGSLTPAGKKRYSSDIEGAKEKVQSAKKEQRKASLAYQLNPYDGKNLDRLNKSKQNVKDAKEDLTDERVKEKLNNQVKKSKRQEKLEARYKEQGFTDEEAVVAAYKRARTEKIIAITAGVTVAAVTAYAAYKHYDKNVDKIMKPDTLLQNIARRSDKGVNDAFYASGNAIDNMKYKGMYGKTLLGRSPNGKVYKQTIKVGEEGLKVASEKSATKVLKEITDGDKQFTSDLERTLINFKEALGDSGTPKQKKTIAKALSSLSKGNINENVYEALNLNLANHDANSQKVTNRFYDALKSKGYDAIKDINDSKLSGYNSINPVIVFNGGAKTTVSAVRELGREEVEKNLKNSTLLELGRQAAIAGGAFAGIRGGLKLGSDFYHQTTDAQIVSEYRKEHPNSKLSAKEIVRSQRKK